MQDQYNLGISLGHSLTNRLNKANAHIKYDLMYLHDLFSEDVETFLRCSARILKKSRMVLNKASRDLRDADFIEVTSQASLMASQARLARLEDLSQRLEDDNRAGYLDRDHPKGQTPLWLP